MLIFCLCLLGMFVCWLFGHLIGYLLYFGILFFAHVIHFWPLYLSLFTVMLLIHWIGITQLTVLLVLTLLIAIALCVSLILTLQLKKH